MRVIKRIGIGIAGVLVLLIIVGYLGSARFFARRYPTEVFVPPIPTDAASIERGGHFTVAVLDCGGCHGVDLGGAISIDNGAIGRLVSPNLTRGKGGLASTYEDADWVRAIRHGVDRKGRGLFFMSSDAYASISNEDLGAAIAWLKQVPPIDRELPALSVGPVGRILFFTGALPLPASTIDHAALETRARQPAGSVSRGQYLAETSGCPSCHGADLKGRALGNVKSTDITAAGLAGWTEEQFNVAMRQGKRPNGTKLNALMPSERAFAKLTPEEMHDLWLWQQSRK